MSVEIEFPVEFLVAGIPVSHQAKRRESISEWKTQVRQASLPALPEGHFDTIQPVAITLLYFPEGEMTGDIDNIVKPILDTLCKHVYRDDRQVERLWVQKFDSGRPPPKFANPSDTLTAALAGQRPVLYIRITNDLAEGRL